MCVLAEGWLRQKAPEAPAHVVRPAPALAAGEDGQALACSHCLTPITTSVSRVSVGGADAHTFVNPHGLRFHIGCFARAACVTRGEASTYWTWFPGHSWQVECCPACGGHLGWLFRSADSLFHGLILDRLIEIESGGP